MSAVRKWVLPLAAMAALVSTSALADSMKGKVDAVGPEGRDVAIKTADGKAFKATVSASRTAITIDGKKAERGALKTGMECTVEAPKDGAEATKVDCK